MGQLSERFAELCREYGSDAAARSSDVHALAALEAHDPKIAHERFLELRRDLAVRRRAQLFAELRALPFVRDVPPSDVRGMNQKEIDREIRWATVSLRHARDATRARDDEAAQRGTLRERVLPPPPALPVAPWDDLAAVAEAAEAHRRIAAREARVEARIQRTRKRAQRAGIPMPEVTTLDAALVDAALDALDASIAAAESLQAAYDEAIAPLKSPEVGEWRRESKRALEREAATLREGNDVAGLRDLSSRAEALRVEAAGLAGEAARSRRRGRAPPEKQRRKGDPMDPYG